MPVDPLFDSAACALAVTQEDGTILHVNPRLCDWLGFTAAQLLGRRFQDLLAMGGRIFTRRTWRRCCVCMAASPR